MELVWAKAGRFLGAGEAGQAAKHGERAAVALVALAACHGRWLVIPKVHAMTHLAYDACELNPRSSHCYQDEDMVGRVKRIYARCHGLTGSQRVLERYRLGVCIKACRRQRERGRRVAAFGPGRPGPAAARSCSRWRLHTLMQTPNPPGQAVTPCMRFARPTTSSSW